MSILSTFGTDSDGDMWDIGAIIIYRWHIFIGLLFIVSLVYIPVVVWHFQVPMDVLLHFSLFFIPIWHIAWFS